MFHEYAWGLPHASTLEGADIWMPGRFRQQEPLARLIEEERVTVAAAVPTIWSDLLRYADEHRPDMSSLRVVPCGGAAGPPAPVEGRGGGGGGARFPGGGGDAGRPRRARPAA